MNSKWQLNRIGLVDFWYYDEEELYFRDGRMLLRGANGSGKTVTMQSFIPLLLDGNMRPERLDTFGSKARKMENYLLDEEDEREERTGYLYMELKREKSEEYLTLGMGIRARKNKKLDSWYFCVTDGRRIGHDLFLYREGTGKVACTMRELKNRVGDGGQVMESQKEYARCVNRLLFGFESQEEYKELMDLLIQLRTPKLSKDFKPTVINEILSGSLQTLSEDDLRPMSEAIENMDSLKTNLDVLKDSIQAAEQIERVYDQYNEIVLYDKALMFTNAVKMHQEVSARGEELEKEAGRCRREHTEEEERYRQLKAEEKILQEERASLSDSDAARLKEEELKLRAILKEQENTISEKRRQEEEKKEKYLEAKVRRDAAAEKNQQIWDEIEDSMNEMEDTLGDVPFDDFSFLKAELTQHREKSFPFDSHIRLLKEYVRKVKEGRDILEKERVCQEKYSRLLQELDGFQDKKSAMEREVLQYENLLHETKQELIEKICQWARGNSQLCLPPELLQNMIRRIESYGSDTDYWEIKNLAKPMFDEAEKEILLKIREKEWELTEKRKEKEGLIKEIEEWKNRKEPEPERDAAVLENRKRLDEKGIPYLTFYQAVDFDSRLDEGKRAWLEETLFHMGILDALIVPAQYREQVMDVDKGRCDRYLFTDAPYVKNNLTDLLDIENGENDILLYQNVSAVLSAVSCNASETRRNAGGTWMDEKGSYGIGIVEGTVTGEYKPRFIGAAAREQYRLEQMQKLEETLLLIEEEEKALETRIFALTEQEKNLENEWETFPKDQDLKVAAREFEKREERLEELNDRIREQKKLVEAERVSLDEIRQQVQKICRSAWLMPRLDVFEKALESLQTYREYLSAVQVAHGNYINGIRYVESQDEYLEETDRDLDQIRYDLGRAVNSQRESQSSLNSVLERLKLTDYEKIKERLEYCIGRLALLPGEIEESVRLMTTLRDKEASLLEKQRENEVELGKILDRKERLSRVFASEYDLGYVKECAEDTKESQEQAKKICSLLAGRFGSRKQSDLLGSLQEMFHKNRGYLLEYQIALKTLFEKLDEETSFHEISVKRIDITAKYRGATVKFKELLSAMREDARIQTQLLSEKDRELFEDIFANTISKKIRSRIQASRRWVEKMNVLMESMQTSSGLTLSLRWKNKSAEKEEQLDTKELVALLQKDVEIMRPEEAQQLAGHFRSKIDEARKRAEDTGEVRSFHGIMKEVLDYRQWFEFQLECQKTGERKKELTDRVFFTFSGGEKAMAMYVPLFSAVAAKYGGARDDAPRLISLDEAFAGVDEMNIRDMFRLMVEFEFNFIINSQILWGDYDTVPGLAIYQLVRPENVRYVTVIRYLWNGSVRSMVNGS